MSKGIILKVWGDNACFTRPEMKVERVSYDVITPSAARGIVEAIHWKPAIRWIIDRIHVLNPICFENIRRNEVADMISQDKVKQAMNRGNLSELIYHVDDGKNRQQRAAVILKNVCYVIEAHFELTEHAEASDNEGKHIDMFRRRARNGQCFYQPYLGTREFTANFELIEDRTAIPRCHEQLNGEKDLGWMLWDIDFKNGMTPHFFRASMTNGIITIPSQKEIIL
ncbi:type I-C CRISPR-associated protein Cas5 [Methyloprofundus sedimenti]|uniref:pre-crRNA processing endonuclease n=1 Tax=Methyloprofundus sedimenti TaxID=1420851 RepID=A0A1V8M7J2_9GAMM|nr:type I-C CRISPR-associated protein Cas5c [Methyloprofundus sedimenti]OQK17509.1 type I-C CRISPR-associated protein Cas5 [Methyloprofundus sedimenti]